MQIAGWALYALLFLNLILTATLLFGIYLIGSRSRKLTEATQKTQIIRDEFMKRKASLDANQKPVTQK
jgi:hypothetical protein